MSRKRHPHYNCAAGASLCPFVGASVLVRLHAQGILLGRSRRIGEMRLQRRCAAVCDARGPLRSDHLTRDVSSLDCRLFLVYQARLQEFIECLGTVKIETETNKYEDRS
jgi:hypothetical protein